LVFFKIVDDVADKKKKGGGKKEKGRQEAEKTVA